MTNVESNNDHSGMSRDKDSGRFNYLKNLKNYRDHGDSFDDPSFGDSGYGNSKHLTFNSTEAGSILRHSTSVLKPISEEPTDVVTATPASSTSRVEKHVTILTPTTQSIQKMSSLQLTTPEGTSAMDLSPFLAPYDFAEPKTPPELLLSIQEPRTANSTPRKSKAYGRKRSFREQIETDTENENDVQKRFRPDNYAKDDSDEKLARRMPFSPVVTKSNRRTLRQRSVSDNNLALTLRSSTPKTFLMRSNVLGEENLGGAVPKQTNEPERTKDIIMKKTPKKTPKKTLRRFQSLSPSKMVKKGKDQVFKKFFQDLNQPSSSRQFQLKNDKGLTNIPEEEPRASFTNLVRQEALDVSDFQTRDLPASEQCSLNITEADLSFLNNASKTISPIKRHPNLESLFDAPILPVLEEYPSISNATSLNVSQSFSSINCGSSFGKASSSGALLVSSDSPMKGLLERDLPRTPQKSLLQRTKSKTPSKKNLFQRRSHYYDGMECLDFINRLNNEGVYHVVEDILKYLSDEDLLNATKVSKIWRSAIMNNKILNNRRIEYITQTKVKNAENLTDRKKFGIKREIFSEISNRKPFTSHNYDTRGMERIRQQSQYSPPASPGKIKFRENQKVVRRLSPRAMTTCPRCNKPSPIITQRKCDCIVKIGRSTRSSAKKTAELRRISSDPSPILFRHRRQSTFDTSPVFEMDSSSGSNSSNSSINERKIRRTLFPTTRSNTLPYDISKRSSINSSLNSSNNSSMRRATSFQTPDNTTSDNDALEEYAVCTGKQCGFKFCIRCKSEYHSNHVCRVIELNSPSRDEDLASIRNTSNRFGSRQSKRTLKRL